MYFDLNLIVRRVPIAYFCSLKVNRTYLSLMEATRFRRFFGALLTLLGIAVLLFACVAFLSDKPVLGLTVSKWESVVPFLVGSVFLLTGVNLVGRS